MCRPRVDLCSYPGATHRSQHASYIYPVNRPCRSLKREQRSPRGLLQALTTNDRSTASVGVVSPQLATAAAAVKKHRPWRVSECVRNDQRPDVAQSQLPRQLTTVRGKRRAHRSCPISCATGVIGNASRRGANRGGRRRFKSKPRRREPIWLMPGRIRDTIQRGIAHRRSL